MGRTFFPYKKLQHPRSLPGLDVWSWRCLWHQLLTLWATSCFSISKQHPLWRFSSQRIFKNRCKILEALEYFLAPFQSLGVLFSALDHQVWLYYILESTFRSVAILHINVFFFLLFWSWEINEVWIPLLIDPAAVRILLDSIAYICSLLDIVDSIQTFTNMLGMLLGLICAWNKSNTVCCLSFGEPIFHDIPENCVLIADGMLVVLHLVSQYLVQKFGGKF